MIEGKNNRKLGTFKMNFWYIGVVNKVFINGILYRYPFIFLGKCQKWNF